MNLSDQAHDFLTGLAVQVSCGLICKQDQRCVDERAGDPRALLLAARKLGRAMPGSRGQADALQRLSHTRWAVSTRHLRHAKGQLDVLLQSHSGEELE